MDNPSGGDDQNKIEMTSIPAAQAQPSYSPQVQQSYHLQPAILCPPPKPATSYLPSKPVVYPAGQTDPNSNTTALIQQPQTQLAVKGPQGWSTGLFDCFSDYGLCLLGLCCPICLPCVVSTRANECCCVGLMCPVALRSSIREKHSIQGTILGDSCILCWCCPCAFCQIGREANNRRV